MARRRTPIFTEIDLKAQKILQQKSDTEVLLDAVTAYTPSISITFSSERYPYSRIWKQYGVTVKGNHFQYLSGFDQSAYTKARRGDRHITAAQLIAACLLSKVSVQQAFDVFRSCKDVNDLFSYGHEAQVLVWMLDDMHAHNHGYDELIWYTLMLRRRDGLTGLPPMHERHRKWIAMLEDVENGISIEDVRRRQAL